VSEATVIHGDCVEEMYKMPAGSVEVGQPCARPRTSDARR